MTPQERTVVIKKGETTPVLLDLLGARLDKIPAGRSEDVKRFRGDLEAALLGLRRLSEELKANFNICPLICEKLRTPEGKEEYFNLLGSDELQRLKVKTKLEALGSCLHEAEQVLRSLPGIIDKSPSADRISDAALRRSVKNSLGQYKNLHDELLEWKKSTRRSLEQIHDSGLFERFDIEVSLRLEEGDGPRKDTPATADTRRPSPRVEAAERPEQPGRAGRVERAERADPPDSSRSPAAAKRPEERRPEEKKARTSEAKRSHRGDATDPAKAERSGGRERRLEELRARLIRWARWQPMVRSGLARDARLFEFRRLKLKVVKMRALWGERCVTEITRPYRAKDVGASTNRSLWDLPAAPPQGFSEGGESGVRVPGGDSVVECGACSGAGGNCRKCEGKGKLLCFRVCDTRYFTRSLSERIAPEDLPARLATLDEGKKVFQDYVFYPASRSDSLRTHHRKCLEAISEQAGSDVREMIVRRLLPEARRAPRGAERQLIRVSLEITTVPLREYSCEPRHARQGKSGRRFRAWIYGARQKRLYVEGCPRELTLKAVALLLAIWLAGVPLGFALMRWITTL